MNIRIGVSMKTQTSSEAALVALRRNDTRQLGVFEYFQEGIDYIENGEQVTNHAAEIDRLVNLYFKKYDGLIIPGNDANINPLFFNSKTESQVDLKSNDNRRTKLEIALVKAALQRGVPVLGICGGHQVIQVALGGKIKDIEDLKGRLPDSISAYKNPLIPGYYLYEHLPNNALHTIISGKDRIRDSIITQEFAVHTQGIDPTSMHPLMVVAAINDEGVISAIDINGHPWMIGTQYHPEFVKDNTHTRAHNNALFENFLTSCRTIKEQKLNKTKMHVELQSIKFDGMHRFALLKELYNHVFDNEMWVTKNSHNIFKDLPDEIKALRTKLESLPFLKDGNQINRMFDETHHMILQSSRNNKIKNFYAIYKEKFAAFSDSGKNVQSKLKPPKKQQP